MHTVETMKPKVVMGIVKFRGCCGGIDDAPKKKPSTDDVISVGLCIETCWEILNLAAREGDNEVD
jgi:hypothetical protein